VEELLPINQHHHPDRRPVLKQKSEALQGENLVFADQKYAGKNSTRVLPLRVGEQDICTKNRDFVAKLLDDTSGAGNEKFERFKQWFKVRSSGGGKSASTALGSITWMKMVKRVFCSTLVSLVMVLSGGKGISSQLPAFAVNGSHLRGPLLEKPM
jgi:hypothetical protein